MNLTVAKKDLLRLATRASAIAEKKSTIPALQLALLGANKGTLTCSATDLYLTLVDDVPADVKTPGSFAVNPRDLSERLKNFADGPVTITAKDRGLSLKSEGSSRRYTMLGMSGEDYPPLPKPAADAATFSLPPGLLSTLIAHTEFSVSPDETRAHLSSALLEIDGNIVRMVSTDGHRLSKAERKFEGAAKADMLLSLKAVHELRRIDDAAFGASGDSDQSLTLSRSGSTLFVRTGSATLSAKLVDAQFPPYMQVIPNGNPHQLTVSRTVLADAVRAVSVAAEDKVGGIKMSVSQGKIRLDSESTARGNGTDEVSCEYDGPNLVIKFSAKYVLDVLGAIGSPQVQIRMNCELDPIVIVPLGDTSTDFLGVIMPMRF